MNSSNESGWSRRRFILGAWTGMALLSGARAADDSDWRQWRGPSRNGSIPHLRLPRDWLQRELKVRWRKPASEGYATPLVDGNRALIFGRDQAGEVIQAFELATGRMVWQVGYPAKFEEGDPKGPHGIGPRSTPILHDGRLFTFGINEVLTCVDVNSGRPIWRLDFPRRYGTEPPGYGAASSPLVAGRNVIVPAGDRIFAVDYRSGSVIWNVQADSFYASIVEAKLDGHRQLIAFTRYQLMGVDPVHGRTLWRVPYQSLFGSNIATPVIWNDRVVISTTSQGTRALRPRLSDNRWTVQPVWQTKSFKAYLTSPVVHGGRLYGLDESGMLHCLDLEDGRALWSGGTFSDFGSMVAVGDQLLILTGYGDLTAVAATGEGYHELGQKQVANSATWSHLSVGRGCLLVRDKKELTCIELPVR